MVTKAQFDEQCITYSQMNMIFNARIFWRRLTIWTRIYLLSRYTGFGTAEELFGRLYLESGDFGDMFRIIFGREISENIIQLLNQYTIGLRDLLAAQLSGDAASVQDSVNRLYQNADRRAAYLASINPFWEEAVWRYFLETYLNDTLEEANSFSTGNYSRDIELFDELTALTNQIGYYFAQGLYDYIASGPDEIITNSFAASAAQNAALERAMERCYTLQEINEIYDIRMFWFELVTWIRAYMLSRYLDIGNDAEVYTRLKQVPIPYVAALEQIFGVSAADGYAELLGTYIDLIDAYITAQMSGDVEEINRITQLLYQNADQRAAFNASLNPYWNVSEWRNRLYNNLRSTIAESSTILSGDYAQNIDIFSTLLNQAESAGNYFAQGLALYLYDQNQSTQPL